jgi:tetratricopeptide (TPR) repeat protein
MRIHLVTGIVLCQLLGAGAVLADEAATYYHKAMVYKRDGNVEKAIQTLHEALEKREDYAAVHFSLGLLYRQKGNAAKAIYHLERAAQLESKNGEILYSLGLAYHRANRVEDAIQTLTKAAALSPKDDQIQSALGTLLIRKDAKLALPYLEAAVRAKPKEPNYVQQLGLAYRKANNLPLAEKYLLQAAELKEDATTEFNLGVLYRRLDKKDKAITHYESAIRLDPKMAEAYWDVAHLYSQLKRAEDAVTSFETYLKLAGDSKDASIARKRIQELRIKK